MALPAYRFAGQIRALVIPPAVLEWLQDEVVASDVMEWTAKAQALRRHQIEMERIQTRLDVLYDDRLDGRIDAKTYDRKAEELRAQQQRAQRKVVNANRQKWLQSTKRSI